MRRTSLVGYKPPTWEEQIDQIEPSRSVARLLAQDIPEYWLKAARTDLDLDLTARILEVRRALAEGRRPETGTVPASLDGFSWTVQETEQGWRISLDQDDLHHSFENPLPLEFEIRATDCPFR